MGFDERRALALRILASDSHLSRRAGGFLGQICADATPLSEAQSDWLEILAEKAGFALEGIAQ